MKPTQPWHLLLCSLQCSAAEIFRLSSYIAATAFFCKTSPFLKDFYFRNDLPFLGTKFKSEEI